MPSCTLMARGRLEPGAGQICFDKQEHKIVLIGFPLRKSWTFDCWQFAGCLAPSTCRPHTFRSLTACHRKRDFLVPE
jgi:hypothetical protein